MFSEASEEPGAERPQIISIVDLGGVQVWLERRAGALQINTGEASYPAAAALLEGVIWAEGAVSRELLPAAMLSLQFLAELAEVLPSAPAETSGG